MKNLIDCLEKRGFIEATTSEEIHEIFRMPQTVYIGFDPTAESLHVGNLVGIMGLAWLKKFGHTPIAIVGGATGMIGDPSGKSVERNLLDAQTLERNLVGIRRSLKAVLGEEVEILNNYEWLKEFGYISFLRDVGKHFRMGPMLAKESVRSRLSSEEGMSYTEFSYQLLQAYDFLYLHQHHGVTAQFGGSDQWGNIIAGTELIRKMLGKTVHGLTFPLLVRSDGKKFGKSEEGAIWLNPDHLSAYDFYQYFYGIPDADLPKMFRLLTFLDLEQIEEIEREMQASDYVPNTAQKRLAEEVTRIVHGEKSVEEALKLTEAAAPGAHTKLNKTTLEALATEMPSREFSSAALVGKKLVDLLVEVGMQSSKGEARRLIANGGFYLNNEKIDDVQASIGLSNFIEESYLLLAVGKKKKMVLRVTK